MVVGLDVPSNEPVTCMEKGVPFSNDEKREMSMMMFQGCRPRKIAKKLRRDFDDVVPMMDELKNDKEWLNSMFQPMEPEQHVQREQPGMLPLPRMTGAWYERLVQRLLYQNAELYREIWSRPTRRLHINQNLWQQQQNVPGFTQQSIIGFHRFRKLGMIFE